MNLKSGLPNVRFYRIRITRIRKTNIYKEPSKQRTQQQRNPPPQAAVKPGPLILRPEICALLTSSGWSGQSHMSVCFPNPAPWRFSDMRASRMQARSAAPLPSGRPWPPAALAPVPRRHSWGHAATGWQRRKKAISGCRPARSPVCACLCVRTQTGADAQAGVV